MKTINTGTRHYIIIGYSDITIPLADIIKREGTESSLYIEDNRRLPEPSRGDSVDRCSEKGMDPKYDTSLDSRRSHSYDDGKDSIYVFLYAKLCQYASNFLNRDVNLAKGIYMSRMVSRNDLECVYDKFGHLFHKSWKEMYYHSNYHRYYCMETLSHTNLDSCISVTKSAKNIIDKCKCLIERKHEYVRRFVNLNISSCSMGKMMYEDTLEEDVLYEYR